MVEVNNSISLKICPKCNRPYHGHPALSRVDNKTSICPDCGTREALESLDVPAEEQEKILQTIHKHTIRA